MDNSPQSPVAATMLNLLDEFVEPRSRYLFPFLPAKEASPQTVEKAQKPKGKSAPASSAPPMQSPLPPLLPLKKIEPRPAPAPAPAPLPAKPQPDSAPLPSHAAASHLPGKETAPGGFASMFKK
jgi:hypothetical protein